MDMVHDQELHNTVAAASRGGLLEDWIDWCLEKAADKMWKMRDAFVGQEHHALVHAKMLWQSLS
eukprot:5988174-Ditylum_brightwellii.AAC.1